MIHSLIENWFVTKIEHKMLIQNFQDLFPQKTKLKIAITQTMVEHFQNYTTSRKCYYKYLRWIFQVSVIFHWITTKNENRFRFICIKQFNQ